MSTAVDRKNLPSLEDYEISREIKPDRFWPEQLLEMADHVGAYAAILIADRYGGQLVHVPRDAALNPFRDLVGAEHATKLSWVYGTTNIRVPVARAALSRARRRSVLASVMAGQLSPRDAAVILRTTRNYVYELLSRPDEIDGEAGAPLIRKPVDTRQISIFDVLDNDQLPASG